MTETETPNTPDKPFPQWIKKLEALLFFIGLVGLSVWFLPKIVEVKSFWLALLMIVGLYIGPLISLTYEYIKLPYQKSLPFLLKLVIGIFLLLSLLQLYRFIIGVFNAEASTLEIGKLLMSILFLNVAFGLIKLLKGWWLMGIVLACLPMALDIFWLIIRFELLLTAIQQLMLVLSQIALFLAMVVILLLPQTRKLFQKPALSPHPSSA